MQIEHIRETSLDRGVPSINGLVYFDQNTKQLFVEFLVTKEATSL
jgi:hypothetical protein